MTNPQGKLTQPSRCRWVLIIPFLLLVTSSVALVGYRSYRSGQRTLAHLTIAHLTEHLKRRDQSEQKVSKLKA